MDVLDRRENMLLHGLSYVYNKWIIFDKNIMYITNIKSFEDLIP